ncbi:hypothetical protein BG015_011826 [Linnemannia schmuckeri]|uniref:Uncharacterized protein n=1 Tax=Linnemannia schmuckeri TaxID=64567 RepID=A0A9P5RVK0_9FUNG|nr:hypothetical protein BG015_011826 [Linnemannia schmuckeri]
MTYKTTVAFSSGYSIELIPAGCTLVNQGTVSCSQAGASMLNLAFQKITAVGGSGGSSLYVDAAAVTTISPSHTGQMITPPAPAPGAETNAPSSKSAMIIGSIFAVVIVAFVVGYAVMRRNMARGSRGRGNGGGGGGKKKKGVDQEHIKYIRPLTTAPTLPQFPAPAATAAIAAMTMRQLDSSSGGRGVDLESQSRFKKLSPPAVLEPESRQQPTTTTATRIATNTASAAPMLARGRSVREAILTRNDRQQQPSTGSGVVGADVRYQQERQRLLAMNTNISASAPDLVASSATTSALTPARAVVETSARSLVTAPTYTLPQPSPPADPVNVSVPVSISTMASLPLPVTTASTAVNGSKDAPTAAAPAPVRGSNGSDWSTINTADLEFLIIPVSNSSAARQKNGSSSNSPPEASIAGEKEEVLDDVDLYDGEREEMLLKKSRSLRYPWSSSHYAGGNGVAASSSATNNVATTAATAAFADTSPLRRAASAGVGGSGGSNVANYNNNSRNQNNSIKYNNSNANTSNYRSYNQQPGGMGGPSLSSIPQLSTMAEQQQQQPLQLQQHFQQQHYRQPAQQQQQQQQYQQKQQKMGWAQSQDDLLMRARSMPRTTITSTSTSTTAMNGGLPSHTMNTQHQQQQGGQGQGQGQRADPRGLYGYL